MGSAQTLKKHNNMPKFLLVDDIGEGLYVVATTKASCKDAAHNYFFNYCAFVSGEILPILFISIIFGIAIRSIKNQIPHFVKAIAELNIITFRIINISLWAVLKDFANGDAFLDVAHRSGGGVRRNNTNVRGF